MRGAPRIVIPGETFTTRDLRLNGSIAARHTLLAYALDQSQSRKLRVSCTRNYLWLERNDPRACRWKNWIDDPEEVARLQMAMARYYKPPEYVVLDSDDGSSFIVNASFHDAMQALRKSVGLPELDGIVEFCRVVVSDNAS